MKEKEEKETAVAAGACVPSDDVESEMPQLEKKFQAWEDNFEDICKYWGTDPANIAEPTKTDKILNDNHGCDPSVPAMPCRSKEEYKKVHRPKYRGSLFGVNACIAKPISKKDYHKYSGSENAVRAEWKRLVNKGVFDLKTFSNWKDVARSANKRNEVIHMGRVFGFMVEKNSESASNKKLKYRVVFQGNNVITQNYEVAMFQDLGSAPASMEAAKCIDCYGCWPGHVTQQADAEQVYVQADLKGTPTCVQLPDEAWDYIPNGQTLRKQFDRPVVRLKKAFYGHPDAGTMWEEHCHKRCIAVGFQPIPNWPSCYHHAQLKLLLTIYVDDFKLSGPSDNISKVWKLLESVLELEEAGTEGRVAGRFLGCDHHKKTLIIDGRTYQVMVYDMEDYLSAICTDYAALVTDLTGKPFKLSKMWLRRSWKKIRNQLLLGLQIQWQTEHLQNS